MPNICMISSQITYHSHMSLLSQSDFDSQEGQAKIIATIHKLEARIHMLEHKIQLLTEVDTGIVHDLQGPEAY